MRVRYSVWSDRKEISSKCKWREGKWSAMSAQWLVPVCWGKKSNCSRRGLVFARRMSPDICRAAVESASSRKVGSVALAMWV